MILSIEVYTEFNPKSTDSLYVYAVFKRDSSNIERVQTASVSPDLISGSLRQSQLSR